MACPFPWQNNWFESLVLPSKLFLFYLIPWSETWGPLHTAQKCREFIRKANGWFFICGAAFELALVTNDKELAYLALDMNSQLSAITLQFTLTFDELSHIDETYGERTVTNWNRLWLDKFSPYINHWNLIEESQEIYRRLPKPVNLLDAECINHSISRYRLDHFKRKNGSIEHILKFDTDALPWENARKRRMIALENKISTGSQNSSDHYKRPTIFNWVDQFIPSRQTLYAKDLARLEVNYYSAILKHNEQLDKFKKRLKQREETWKIYRYDLGEDRPEWKMEELMKDSGNPKRVILEEDSTMIMPLIPFFLRSDRKIRH